MTVGFYPKLAMTEQGNVNLASLLLKLEKTPMPSAVESLKNSQAAVARLSNPDSENRREVVNELMGMSPEFYAFLFRQAQVEETDSIGLSLSLAIDKLGFERIKRLVLFHVASSMDKVESEKDQSFSNYLWKLNYRVAYTASHWMANFSRDLSEEIFFMGLLQNLGISAFACVESSRHRGLRDSQRKVPLVQKEESCYGFNHYDLGIALVEAWGLPRVHSSAMRYEETHGQATMEMAGEEQELMFLLLYAAKYKAMAKDSRKNDFARVEHVDPFFPFDRNLLEFAAERIGELKQEAG